MKKLFLLITLFSFSLNFAQAPDGMVEVKTNRYDLTFAEADAAFNNKYQEAAQEAAKVTDNSPKVRAFKNQLKQDLVEIIIVASVLEIRYDSALVVTRDFSKHFKVNTAFLQQGWEYKFKVIVNKETRKMVHCSGCSGTLPATIIGYALSERQAKLNAVKVSKSTEEAPFYNRSPRYH